MSQRVGYSIVIIRNKKLEDYPFRMRKKVAIMLPGKALTTAMGILPHKNLPEAQKLALSLDIPFWPQLPHLRFREDMYAQFSEHFPGIIIDEEKAVLRFSHERFAQEFDAYLEASIIGFFSLSVILSLKLIGPIVCP